MTTPEKLNQIRARCVELQDSYALNLEMALYSDKPPVNASLIAPFEASLKSTIAAIDWLLESDRVGDYLSDAILSAWPDELMG